MMTSKKPHKVMDRDTFANQLNKLKDASQKKKKVRHEHSESSSFLIKNDRDKLISLSLGDIRKKKVELANDYSE